MFRAASTTAEAQAATEQFTRTQVLANVRAAFFAARAQKALVAVARETLANQGRHRDQVRGFVEVGRQPQIALAQVETDYANAEVQSISAANALRGRQGAARSGDGCRGAEGLRGGR